MYDSNNNNNNTKEIRSFCVDETIEKEERKKLPDAIICLESLLHHRGNSFYRLNFTEI